MTARFLALLLFLSIPLSAAAQTEIEGLWAFSILQHDGNTSMTEIHVTVKQDSLQMTMKSQHGDLPLQQATFDDNKISFLIATGHGDVSCDLFKQTEEDYSGSCTGPNGEAAATLRRSQSHGSSH